MFNHNINAHVQDALNVLLMIVRGGYIFIAAVFHTEEHNVVAKACLHF